MHVLSQVAPPRLVESLARVAAKHAVAHKLLVSTTAAAGRELLRRLALGGEGWIGFEVTTPRPLALRLARPAMEASEVAVVDAFEARALLDEAMDVALASEGAAFGALSDGVGFRERAHGAIEALRLAGIGPRELERARLSDGGRRRFLLKMLRRYEELLGARRRVDTADVFRLALSALEAEGTRLPLSLDADVVVLLPGLGTRGLTGRLLSALGARGAKVLETDPVIGLETPPRTLWRPGKEPGLRSHLHAAELAADSEARATDLFRAASINDELREVLRRAMAKGFSWDQVEIITPDPAAYGSVLHGLCRRLGIPVTFAVGLPIERTRTGRVLSAYLDWIEEGFQADPIRRLLEAGDLKPPRSAERYSGAALARRFRSLRIGWGRMRYRTQIKEALAGVERLTPGRYETEEGLGRRRERMKGELQALRSILFPALKATPSVPDDMGEVGKRVSPAELSRGLRAFLRRVPKGIGPDRAARDEVDRVLERVEATLVRRTAFPAALTVLRRYLELRVRPVTPGVRSEDGAAPWSSEGGHLHMSDLEHGGYSGREAVFIVGLDAERTLGNRGQDPILLDGDRRILGEELPTSIEQQRERDFAFAALFARLHGPVTLSYSAWDATEARSVAPSPLLLQALRLTKRNVSLTFRDLAAALGRVVCAAPGASREPLDADDVWMAELSAGGLLRAGTDRVATAFPRLAAGLVAGRARLGDPGVHNGVVPARPEALDPRRNASLVVSASRLQDLGTCPLRYLHSFVLGIRPPDDPELDPDRWLDALGVGSLLHSVYDATLREAKSRGVAALEPAFEALALEVLEQGIARLRVEVPVPGEGALQRQAAALRNDVRSFVRMVRQRGAPWVALELKFGLGDDEPVAIELAGGTLRLRGAIDRVDEDLRGLTVIDYKTGVPREFGGTGSFNGGRRLQHGLYSLVASTRFRGEVVSGEFHFPTIRGENQVLRFDRLQMAGVQGLVDQMLDGVAHGSFVPTESADDCKFCDFAEVCRAREVGYGKMNSPLASWSEGHLNASLWPAFVDLKRVRTFES